MYVVVNHEINNPTKFWAAAESALPGLPNNIKVIHTLPAPDGRRAVCVWEAESVDAVRKILEPATAGAARNEYFQALNKEGIAMPTLTRAAGA